MGLFDYIAEADTLYPNTVDASLKEKWLNSLEERLRYELADVLPRGTELVGAVPYDGIYTAYLRMKIAEVAGDINRFNNALSLFESERTALFAHYVRDINGRKGTVWKNVL